MYGYWGKILRVNLTEEKISVASFDRKFAEMYVGGNGFGARLLYDEVKPGIDPLSPENKLIFSPGLFTGLGIPTASKSGFYAKSPQTLGLGESIVGARLGISLKKAGYDALIIEGKANAPSIIWIENENVEIIRADDIWGLNTLKAQKLIKNKVGANKAATAVIGPAGENLVLFSCIECDGREAGRTGLGAVMGSKLLKGIAAVGSNELEVADRDKLRELSVKWAKIIKNNPGAQLQVKIGTGGFHHLMNELGVLPTKNWLESYFEDEYKRSGEEYGSTDPYYWVSRYVVKNTACPSCNKPCGKLFKVKEGKYKGTVTDGPEFEAQYSLGSECGISNIEALAHANMLCDLYGVDVISVGVTIGWAMECYEKGILTKTDGIKLNFGNEDALIKAIELIAFKKGDLGALLSGGVKRASEKIGNDSSKFAMHIKGLEIPAYDVRGLKGVGLSFAVSTRGACHLRACMYSTELYGRWWKFRGVDRFSSKNKGFLVKFHEDFVTLYDILGLCKFSRHIYGVSHIPEIFETVTGRNISVSELLIVGERTYNIEKAFNVREGFNRRHDSLPYRILHEPINTGSSKGNLITPAELQRMLDDYYTARGWSEEGVPTKAKLISLDLPDIAEEVGV
ncbi:MAG: aldehyde ferredoxin oxidoreductase family protein [Candidatus Odinarchaeia archaeon]